MHDDSAIDTLIVVARDREALYKALVELYADAPTVRVVFDRRLGERRSGSPAVWGREAERRARPEVEAVLRRDGFVQIPLRWRR